MAVDTPGNLLAAHVTAASQQDRAHVSQLAQQTQEVTQQCVQVVFVDQAYTGDTPHQADAQTAGRQAAGCQTRLYLVASPPGCRAFLRLDGAFSSAGP